MTAKQARAMSSGSGVMIELRALIKGAALRGESRINPVHLYPIPEAIIKTLRSEGYNIDQDGSQRGEKWCYISW